MDAVAQAEHVLELLDAHWFHHQILRKQHLPPPPPPPAAAPLLAVEIEDAESRTSDTPPSTTRPRPPPPFHRRSLSDDAFHSFPETLNIRPSPKLQTILSGKVAGGGDEEVASSGDVKVRIVPRRRNRRGRSRTRSSGASSRSLTDLEFEELRGFMDLGFTFPEAGADPRLIAIVPGLQRLRSPSASDAGDDQPARRPYLAEAWESAAAEEEEEDPLRNWRIPAAARGVDMKGHLRCWAHAVASTVR